MQVFADLAAKLNPPNRSVVYSIEQDGKLTLNKSFRTVWGEADEIDSPNKIVTDALGPSTFTSMIETIHNMKKNNVAPFLVVQFYSDYTVPLPLYYEFIKLSKGTFATENRWVIEEIGSYAHDYIYVGHGTETGLYNSTNYDKLMKVPWLYAHKSICFKCPGKNVNTKVWVADPNLGPNEVGSLYSPLGFFAKNNCIAVAKPFLVASPFNAAVAKIVNNPLYNGYYYLNQTYRGSTYFGNTLSPSKTKELTLNYQVCISADEALDNWLACILRKSSDINAIWQNLLLEQTRTLDPNRTLNVMKAYCNSDMESSAYANACACLGRKGVEKKLQETLGNERIRMVCVSETCLQGDKTGDVFTFTPSPPCEPINICKPGLDVNATELNMSNVTLNCNFAPGSATSTSEDKTAEAAAPGSSGLSNTVKIAIGSSVLVFVLLLVAILVVAIKRRRRNR